MKAPRPVVFISTTASYYNVFIGYTDVHNVLLILHNMAAHLGCKLAYLCIYVFLCSYYLVILTLIPPSPAQVSRQAEGEARRYYEHAITLRNTVLFLRNNPALKGGGSDGCGLKVDLLRLESMASLDTGTLSRILQKNYR